MAAVTVLRRATGKAHPTSVLEADTILVGGLELSATGTGSLFEDAFVTAINIGGGALSPGINLGDSSTTTTVAGNLVVQGTTTSVDSEVVNIADNHLYLNKDYTTAVAQTGGLVVNYLPTATVDTEAAGGFTAATTVATTGAAVFSAGDFIQISGAANAANDGLYEVLTHAGNVLTIDATPAHSFSQTAFTVDATGSTASFTQVTVSALQSGTDGTWETGAGSTAAGLIFSDIGSGAGNSLGSAYAVGNAISMTDANGNFAVSVGSGTPAITLDAGGASNFTVASASLTLATTTSGAVIVSSAGAVTVDGLGVSIDGTADSNLTLTAAAAATALTQNILVTNTGTTTSPATINIDANSTNATGTVAINATGTANGAIDIGTDAAAQLISIGNATGATAVTIDAGTGGISLDTAVASNITVSGAAADLTLGARGATITLNEAGDTTLSGFTATSIIGALNEALGAATGADTWAEVLTNGATSGATNPTITTGQSIVGADELTLVSTTTGAASLDSGTTGAVNIGAGASAKTVTIGNVTGATSVVVNAGTGNIDIGTTAQARTTNIATGGAAQAVSLGSLTTTSSLLLQSGATGSITFDANAMTTPLPFNGTTSGDSGNQDISSNFAASTLVGVLNELKEAGVAEADQVVGDFITTGLTLGHVVYMTGTADTVADTDASALATSESYAGIVKTIGALGTGEVVLAGVYNPVFETGSARPANGAAVYLSETAGVVTGTAPSGTPNSGIVIYRIGFMKDQSTLTATVLAGERGEVLLAPGQFIEL